MVWKLFVLDKDGTYNNETPDSVGVQPSVYLIPLDKQIETEHFAVTASQMFQQNSCGCMDSVFEKLLDGNKIPFKYIGDIDLTFGERQVDYLADYIPREVV